MQSFWNCLYHMLVQQIVPGFYNHDFIKPQFFCFNLKNKNNSQKEFFSKSPGDGSCAAVSSVLHFSYL